MKLIDISTPKFPNTFAKVDDEDFEWLNKWKWFAGQNRRKIYAYRTLSVSECGKRYKRITMHQILIKKKSGMVIDHVNSDGLDNRKANLRVCTVAQNLWNTGKKSGKVFSNYKGVSYEAMNNRFRARITCNKKRISLGSFLSETEAAIAYNNAAKILHGEYAFQNLIGQGRLLVKQTHKERR